MSEQDWTEGKDEQGWTEGEDVEGHRRSKKMPMAAEEPSDEAEGDDVEAHALRNRPQSL